LLWRRRRVLLLCTVKPGTECSTSGISQFGIFEDCPASAVVGQSSCAVSSVLPIVLQFLGVRSFFACFQVPSPPSFLRSSFVRQSPSPSLWPSSSLFLPSLIRVTRRLVIGWMWSVGGVLVSCALCGVTFVPCAFCLMCSGRASVSKLSTCKSTDTPLSVRAVCRTHCLLRS